MTPEEKRERRLQVLDDHIGRALAHSHQNGELRSAPSFGKPLHFGDGYEETPAELRMGYKIMKDAGVLPPEVQLMQQIEALRQSITQGAGTLPAAEQQLQHQRLSDLRQQLALRLEKLGSTRAL